MASELFANSIGTLAIGTLASDPGSGGTTLTLTTGHGARFPAVATGQQIRLQCEDEIMLCTAHTASADTFTVTRGAEATTAAAHAAGKQVSVVLTTASQSTFGVRGDWKPQHASRLGESFAPDLVSANAAGSAAAAGFLHMVKVWVDDPTALTNLHFFVNNGGSVLTVGQCFGFMYNEAGTLIAKTADLSTVLTSTGYKTLAWTAEAGQSLAVGGAGANVHLGLLINGTNMPSIVGLGNAAGILGAEFGLTTSTQWRFLRTSGAGNTSVPSTRPSSGNLVEDTGRQWWMAVS